MVRLAPAQVRQVPRLRLLVQVGKVAVERLVARVLQAGLGAARVLPVVQAPAVVGAVAKYLLGYGSVALIRLRSAPCERGDLCAQGFAATPSASALAGKVRAQMHANLVRANLETQSAIIVQLGSHGIPWFSAKIRGTPRSRRDRGWAC